MRWTTSYRIDVCESLSQTVTFALLMRSYSLPISVSNYVLGFLMYPMNVIAPGRLRFFSIFLPVGRAIFTAFFWGTISVEPFLNLLNDAPFSYGYLLVWFFHFLNPLGLCYHLESIWYQSKCRSVRLTQFTQNLNVHDLYMRSGYIFDGIATGAFGFCFIVLRASTLFVACFSEVSYQIRILGHRMYAAGGNNLPWVL